ncbi:anti-sigma factor domain-containing protein [Paenibacillus allorhizosphaerae]|uniref:RsgI N-terminal anti-sigma domain-containing protein n=1 Tax=Paenibacillus allorhizosphaerae TaxID=2849866 RepID=A0ABN7TS00_9BACL|nr:anti-sigma factor domain-containing protein [Paenibacillus allorhizosphaerae]CAG7646637.1 hypothetical protein PAECIP111802_03795 [Paenibacillus allorhizosphaerae]
MNKGVVMEISDKSIIVMRPDGKFERVSRKKRNCEIGEEIAYADSGINWRSPSVAGRSAIAAAVIFCLVLFASFNGKLGSPEVIAYISMDINPSIEMGIDMNENVLELRGLNEDGNELVQNISYKGEKLESVASRLLDKAEEKSLAKGEAEIVIASTVVQENAKVSDTQLATKLQEQVTKHIEKTHPAEASSYQVAAFAAPQEVRQAAVQNGVSMGKYTVYLNAKNSGTEVTLDELKKGSVLQLSKEKPEISKAIQSGAIPSKSDIKKLVEEEKSGQLDKKLEEKLKEKRDNNGKGSTTTGSQPGKNGQTNQNEKNGQGNQTNQNGQNGKTDPKKPGTAVPSKPTDKKDNDKKDRDDDKKDDRKDNKSTPVTTRPGTNPSNPQTKPGTTNPGTVRPGDKQDDRKEQEKKKEEERKREEALKNEEQRRKEETARRLEEQKKKAEEQKKEQEKKDQEKREQEKKEQEKKEQDKRDQDKKEQDNKDQDKNNDRKTDDSKKNDGKDDDKSRGGGR